MTAYQQCPFCERVFAIGWEDYEPMKRHIGLAHQDSIDSGGRRPNGNGRGTRRSPPPPAA